jgi:PKD domain
MRRDAMSVRRARTLALIAVAAVTGPACDHGPTNQQAPPALTIECAALPASGPAPLSVAFGLDVKNAVGAFSVSLSYGDGAQGTNPDARHVYAVAGDYVAAITVTAGAETARCSLPIAVAGGPLPTPSPGADNQWPDPSFRTQPAAVGSSITGKAPLSVLYNLCRSQDPENDGLFFRMDLDGDGTFEWIGTTGADCSHSATYAAGTRTATVCVTDGDCPNWPLCEDLPRWRFHPYQCMSYTVTATP